MKAAAGDRREGTMDTIEHNVAVLKRLREMLARQRQKLGDYLQLLECEGDSIERGDTERLLAQVGMEKSLIADLFTLKKVIEPLEGLYQAAYPAGSEESVPKLQNLLEDMGTEIIVRNARNRQRLRERMEELRAEIAGLRAWPKAASPFAPVSPNLIDITT
jgi:flagellar biosynthesis/type III secretory pathway chaperone